MTSEQLNEWVIQVMRPEQKTTTSHVKGTNVPVPEDAMLFLESLPVRTIIVVPQEIAGVVCEDSFILTGTALEWVQCDSFSFADKENL